MKPVVFIVRIQSPFSKSAKLRTLRAKNVLACQRVFCAHVLACQRDFCAYVLTCQRALRAYMLMCQRALRAYLLTCQRVLLVYVLCLPCFACSRASVSCVLCVSTCLRATTTNNKDKFSITCFRYIFVIVFCLFPVK